MLPDPFPPVPHATEPVAARRRKSRRHAGHGALVLVAALTLLTPSLSACTGNADAEASSPGVDKTAIEHIVAAAASASASSAAAAKSPSATSPSTKSPPAATTSPGASPSPSAASVADFPLPEAAKAHTHEGAKAFVQFYWEMLGKLDAHPQTGVIERFAGHECKSCQMQMDTAKTLVAESARVETLGRKLSNFRVCSDSLADYVIVTFRQQDSGGVRVSDSGKRMSLKPNDLNVAARADWDGSGWKLGAAGADQR